MRILFILGMWFAATATYAAPRQLDDAGLVAAYASKTHLSFYRRYVEEYGGKYFEETYNSDGTLQYRAGEMSLAGKWRVADGQICFEYPGATLYGGCFIVVYDAGCYYSYEIGPDGAPIGYSTGEWWIRAHIKGTRPDCAAADLVS